MYKKYLIFIFSIFMSIYLLNIDMVNSEFLSDTPGLDLYKDISNGYYNIELKYVERELKGGNSGGSIANNLNYLSSREGLDECFAGNVSPDDLEKVYRDDEGSSQILYGLLSKCNGSGENGQPLDDVSRYRNLIRVTYKNSVDRAKSKVNGIAKIGKIGMYSDGLDENSPFDLITDIDHINYIIFEDEIPYDGVNTFDLGGRIGNMLSGMSSNDSFLARDLNGNTLGGSSNNGGYGDNGSNNLTDIDDLIDIGLCIADSNKTPLSPEIFAGIISQSNPGLPNNGSSGSTGSDIPSKNTLYRDGNIGPVARADINSQYERLVDNDMWPCNDFFCIKFDFVIYNHNLLGGGTNLSIEGLIKRSNEHLKSMIGSSFIQSKMTINNFEIGLKDLNLPDLFHIGVDVNFKPVPLYNIEPDEQKEKNTKPDDYEFKNIRDRYYKNMGLEADRANDLIKQKKLQDERQILQNAIGLGVEDVEEEYNKMKKYYADMQTETSYVFDNVVEGKVIDDDMAGFYDRYIELESFVRDIMEYTVSLQGIVKGINNIKEGI